MATTRRHKRSRRSRGQATGQDRASGAPPDRSATPAEGSSAPPPAGSSKRRGGTGRHRRRAATRQEEPVAEEAPDRDEDAGRHRRSGRGGRSSRREPASASGRRGDEHRSKRYRPRQTSKVKSGLLYGGLILLGILVIVTLAVWQPIARGMQVDAIVEAGNPQVRAQRIDEFLAMVEYDGDLIGAYLIDEDRLDTAVKLEAVTRAFEGSGRKTSLFPRTIHLAERVASSAERAEALRVATAIFDAEQHANDLPVSKLKEWALQEGAQQPDRPVATAAIALIGRAHAAPGLEADRLLRGIINDPTKDRTLVEAAIESLAGMTNSENVATALMVLAGPNADSAITSETLCSKIRAGLRTTHLEAAIDLLNHPNPKIQAFGMDLFAAPNLSLGNSETDQEIRAGIATEISKRLTADTVATDPEMTAALLNAINSLKLTNTSGRLVELIPAIKYEEQKQELVKILGSGFIDTSSETAVDASNRVLATLAEAVDDPERQAVVFEVIGTLDPDAKKCTGLYDLTLATIAQSGSVEGDAAERAMRNAIAQLVGKIYLRPGLLDRFAGKPDEWREFIAKDRPRFEKWLEMKKWHAENHVIRVSQGKEVLREKSRILGEYEDLLRSWLRGRSLPLALQADQVQRFLETDLKLMRNGLFHDGGVGRAPRESEDRRPADWDPIRGTDRPQHPLP